MRREIQAVFFIAAFIMMTIACKGSSDSDDSDDSNTDTLEVNPLAEAYPQGLTMGVLSDESTADEDVTSGALAIDDSASLYQQATDVFELATGTDLLGYDREACDTYHDGLTAEQQESCSCSHAGARASMGNENDGDINGDAPTETDVIGAIFAAGGNQVKEAEERLRGSDDVACFSPKLKDIVRTVLQASRGQGLYNVYCYEFDWGIEHPYRVNGDEQVTSAKQPCLVAFTRKEMAEAQAYLSFATQMTQALLCQAKKSGVANELAVGQDLELTDVLDALDQETVEPTFASIARLNDVDGGKVYETDFHMTVSPPEGGDDLEFEFNIRHSPEGDDNRNYSGVLGFEHTLPNRGDDTSEKFKALSITYESSYADDNAPRRVNLGLRMGEFKIGTEAFVDGEVDFNAAANEDGSFDLVENENLSNMKYVVYDGYPTEGVMNFSYWRSPGEQYNENARGFIFNVERTDDDVIKGCAFAGASAATDLASAEGVSIRKALANDLTLEPKGFLRPFICPYNPPAADPSTYTWTDADNRNRRFGGKIWKQCFVQNSDGSYELDKTQTDGKAFSFASTGTLGDFIAPPPPPPPPLRR